MMSCKKALVRGRMHTHMGIVLVLLLVSFYATCILAPPVVPRIVDFAIRVILETLGRFPLFEQWLGLV